MANNTNKLVIGAIGCLFLLGLSGLSCMGLGTLGYFYVRSVPSQVAVESPAPAHSPSFSRVDLLSDAAFLDVSAGPFAFPVTSADAADAEPSEPLRPVIQPAVTRPSPRAPAATAPTPSAPEDPLIEDDQEPIISDEDVQALDAEVQQIEAEKAAEAASDTKKKKRKN